MRYISTRGQSAPQAFCDILLGGLAPDGGLYLPENYPQVTRAELDDSVNWSQLIGVAALAGVGFTVALLVADLSFSDPMQADTASLAVMVGSLLAIVVAAALLVRPKRKK